MKIRGQMTLLKEIEAKFGPCPSDNGRAVHWASLAYNYVRMKDIELIWQKIPPTESVDIGNKLVEGAQ